MRIMITGGGSGGHLFPGIAVADSFLARFPAARVMFVGSDRHIENKVLAQRSFERGTIKSQGLKGKSLSAAIRAMLLLPISVFQAAMMIRRFKPELVFGVGGYVTGPVVLAARFMGIATCIHEQNSVPGLANRLLGKIVHRIFISIPGSEKYFSADKTVLTGNPVRQELRTLKNKEVGAAKKKTMTLLVMGGSQGARSVNRLVTAALSAINELPQGFKVIHQTGSQDAKWVEDTYAQAKIKAKVAAFFDDMGANYDEADLVLSRAGATSLAEITALALPAILIPFPFAADDHQEKNGLYMVAGGAAKMFLEKDITPQILAYELQELFNNQELRDKMASCAGRLARTDAAKVIVDECLTLIENNFE